MIQSNRRFGVEIEFVAPTGDALTRIRQSIEVIEDGSLRPLKHAGEWVSEPLSGEEGERAVEFACETLKKNGATCDNAKTSMHIHLDGKKDVGGVLKSSRSEPSYKGTVFAFSSRVKKDLGIPNIMNLLQNQTIIDDSTIKTAHFGNVVYFSRAELMRKPRVNYTYYYLEKPDRLQWLKNSFYFYTLFSGVMENIVSNSRRFGNMYCIPLGESYELSDIAAIKTEEDLKRVWYKGRGQTGHYDNSRYHNVNLHCYWDRHGTLEIRSHGGTTDAGKVLLWLRLHQAIADKLETLEFEELKSMKGTPEEFVKFLDDEMLEMYVKRLLGYYSGITVK